MIRKMTLNDTETVFQMMQTFYNSDAVYTNGSEEIFKEDIENCISDFPYVEGYVYDDTVIKGYMMLAKSYSTEFGKSCIWIEDIYVQEDYRGQGIASQFLQFVVHHYKEALIRLEVEEDNQTAIELYKKFNFEVLPYMQMKK